MRSRSHQLGTRHQGITLIEMMVVTAIIALVMTGMALGLGAITNQRLKSSAVSVASAIRMAYSRSATTGKTVRLVFDFQSRTFWAEEAEGGRVLLDREGEEEREDEEAAELAEGQEEQEEPFDATGLPGVTPGGIGAGSQADALSGLVGGDPQQMLEAARGAAEGDMPEGLDFDLMGQLGTMGTQIASELETPRYQRPRFSSVPGRLGQPNELERGVTFDLIYTAHRERPADEGRAYLYFFTSGLTELSVIQLRDANGYVNSVEVHPLTGRCTIHNVPYEPPYREEDRNEAAEML